MDFDRKILYRKKREKKVFTFDIDGTITVETEGWDYYKRTPRWETIYKIRELCGSGEYYIILWTSRLSIDKLVTEAWLDMHGVPYDELVFGKPYFDKYICDKACHVDQFLKENEK